MFKPRVTPLRRAAIRRAALAVTVLTVTLGMAGCVPWRRQSVGVQFHCNWSNWTDSDRTTVLDKMKRAGLTWVRIDVGWASIEPSTKGTYDFSLNDKCVQMATSRGFRVLETLWMTPGWANGNRGPYVPPNNVSDYGDIAKVVATRYDGQHGVGHVAAWEIWNEPDPSQSLWEGTIPQYVWLVKASYWRFHGGDPSTTVVVGGPNGNRSWYIDQLYGAGLTGSDFDAISVHPYQIPSTNPPDVPDPAYGQYGWPGDAYLTHTPTLHQLMVNHGDGNKAIWWTEFGWSTNTGGTDKYNTGVSKAQQGDYFVQTLKLAESYPYVTHVFWYDARDDSTSPTDHNSNFGLLYNNLAPKPSYDDISRYLNH